MSSQFRRIIQIISVLFFIILCSGCFRTQPRYADLSPDMQAFIARMEIEHQFDRNELVVLFQQTEYLQSVVDKMNKPFEKKPWDEYREFFITKERIHDGVKYWHKHKDTLEMAQQKYGVDPAIIVAIIGIETDYGDDVGHFSELSALTTLAFYYPKRGPFFQSELEEYLLLSRDYQLHPLALKGSYAGALGIPQFMPSNYRRYAVSYSGNPEINLLENDDDAILSIANFLKKSGWQADQPVATPAHISSVSSCKNLISKKGKPNVTFSVLENTGVTSDLNLPPSQKTALIAMATRNGNEYWLVFPNFYAIMCYNPRTNYALAIYELSQAIKTNY